MIHSKSLWGLPILYVVECDCVASGRIWRRNPGLGAFMFILSWLYTEMNIKNAITSRKLGSERE